MSTLTTALTTATTQDPRTRIRTTRVSPKQHAIGGESWPTRPTRTRRNMQIEDRSMSSLDEARRRLKSNMLAVISRLRLDEGGIDPAPIEAILTDMETRVQSMAALHKAACRGGDFEQIDLAIFLRLVSSLRNSPATTPLQGGFVVEPDGSLIWADEADGVESRPTRALDLETALDAVALESRDVARRALYACAIVFPPSLFHWRAPQMGPAGTGHLARPSDVGIRLRLDNDGVVVELSISDCGPGLPGLFDSQDQRRLSLELTSVLARLVLGSLKDDCPSEAVFDVAFVASHRDYTLPVDLGASAS
jgi:two-component sensor histidine kinase